LALVGAGATVWNVFQPRRISEEQISPAFQKWGESLARTLGYGQPVLFVVDRQFNASASREFGLFGKRVVTVGEPLRFAVAGFCCFCHSGLGCFS